MKTFLELKYSHLGVFGNTEPEGVAEGRSILTCRGLCNPRQTNNGYMQGDSGEDEQVIPF